MHTRLVCVLMLLGLVGIATAAPATETVGVTTFTTPKGWSRVPRQDAIVELRAVNERAGAGGSIMILPSFPSGGDGRTNFDQAWQAAVASATPGVPAPTVARPTRRDGWAIVRGTATYKYEGRPAATTLLTATRDGVQVIVVGTTIGPAFKKDVDRVLAALRFAAPTPPALPAPAPASAPAASALTSDLVGAWGFSTGGAMGPGAYAAWLSDRREYAFDGRGGYTFLRRHNVDRDPDSSIIRERGTYTLVGDVLTLSPSKVEREIWSKDAQGGYVKLTRREKVAAEKTAYRVAFTLYPDTNVPNLMLTPAAATQRDGNFNASTQYRLFRPDGRYYTAIPPTP